MMQAMEKELKNRFRESVVERPDVEPALIAPPQLREIVMGYLQQDARVMAAIQGFLASLPKGVYDAELQITFRRRGDLPEPVPMPPPNGAGGI
jgi:hypothetical protein